MILFSKVTVYQNLQIISTILFLAQLNSVTKYLMLTFSAQLFRSIEPAQKISQ